MPYAPDLSGCALDGRYELHELIGEGTFGRVYRGLDRRLGRPVAVKVIKPWWAEDPEWVETFEREARLLASMSDPGIVQIFDVGSAPEGLYYVAELVEGESLAVRLRGGPLPALEACDVAEQLSRALARAHAKRVVHRDVKPANVLLSRDGRIKVGDFGVAYLAEGSSDGAAGTIAGTPKYMAPEQARGAQATPATDVYGVGIVLYEMLAGSPPFEGSSSVELALRHVHDAPPPLPAGTPRALAEVVDQALAKDPAERYADGRALADALAEARVARDDDELALRGSGGAGGVATLAPPKPPRAATRRAVRPAPAARSRPRPAERPQRRGARTQEPATILGEPMSPRRNVNPAARRRTVAAVGIVLLVAAGLVVAALALAPGSKLTVPNLHGLAKVRIERAARRDRFHATFTSNYSAAPAGTAIAQTPRAHARVGDGATVAVVLSAGPAPVPVPKLIHRPLIDAETVLGSLKLRETVTYVPAPGVTAGIVTAQSPSAGTSRRPGSTVALSVAERPRYRAVTSFSGTGHGSSVAFTIRGTRWQLVESMHYIGTCTFIFFCSGPSATVTNVSTGKAVDHFGLADGSNHARAETLPPGTYQVTISPGDDDARWSVSADDYY
jgi:serine/threonine-protein kinase